MIQRSLALFLLLLPAVVSAETLSVSERLAKLAGSLAKAHEAARPGHKGDSLAVFDFNTDEKLGKERVGFAVSELLLQKFVQSSAFTVVERAALQRVLDEQKLQKSGAIDPETAVKVGRITGAHLLLLGSVEKVGSKFQVNARVVSVESGEVVAAAFEEFPKKDFEEEAKSYLALVPESRWIGIYLEFGAPLAGFSIKTPAGTHHPVENPQGALGLRYNVWKNLLVDAAVFPQFPMGSATDSSGKYTAQGGDGGRVLLGMFHPLSPHLWARGDAGFMIERINFDDHATQQTSKDFNVPMVRLGLEWKPQERLGLSAYGTFLKSGTVENRAKTAKATTPTAILQLSVGFYF